MVESKEYDYSSLLKRVKEGLPKSISDGERFQLPELDLFVEGKNTVFRNFLDIVEKVDREPRHLLLFLLRELGTAGDIESRRVIFKGQVSTRQIDEKMKAYLDTYVICSECGRPDTKLVKEGRTLMLACSACGAMRSVKSKKAIAAQSKEDVYQVGKVLNVMITDLGNHGHGLVKKDEYLIIVPNTTKGEQVKAQIIKVSGTKVFCKKVE
jgi:translation initiation factor 2 subunit 2